LASSGARIKLIETFNEVGEGSVIEPATPIIHRDPGPFQPAGPSWGTAYLDAVASAFGGGPAKAASVRVMRNLIGGRTYKQQYELQYYEDDPKYYDAYAAHDYCDPWEWEDYE
jgi:hypothetical protein